MNETNDELINVDRIKQMQIEIATLKSNIECNAKKVEILKKVINLLTSEN